MRLVSTPASRANDPQGSHNAERRMRSSGRLRSQQLMCAAAVKSYPGKTAAELSQVTGLDRYMLGRRLRECVTAGAVREGDHRKCAISHITVLTWWPV